MRQVLELMGDTTTSSTPSNPTISPTPSNLNISSTPTMNPSTPSSLDYQSHLIMVLGMIAGGVVLSVVLIFGVLACRRKCALAEEEPTPDYHLDLASQFLVRTLNYTYYKTYKGEFFSVSSAVLTSLESAYGNADRQASLIKDAHEALNALKSQLGESKSQSMLMPVKTEETKLLEEQPTKYGLSNPNLSQKVKGKAKLTVYDYVNEALKLLLSGGSSCYGQRASNLSMPQLEEVISLVKQARIMADKEVTAISVAYHAYKDSSASKPEANDEEIVLLDNEVNQQTQSSAPPQI